VEEFRGSVDRVIYSKDGFCVFSFKTNGQVIKAKGNFLGLEIHSHMQLKLKGVWTESKYGRDLDVKTFEEVEPDDVEGITNYLVANVKGVGWATAKRIAEHFGEQTVSILTGDPNRVLELHFLNDAQKQNILECLTRNQAYRDVSVFLMSFSVSALMVSRIYEKFGNEAKEILTRDPYRLTEVRGWGFKRADEVAIKMGIDPRSPLRVKAVIKYVLNEVIGGQGHLFLLRSELKAESVALLGGVPEGVYEDCVAELMTDGEIMIDGPRIYGASSYFVETSSAMKLSEFVEPVNYDFDLEAFVEEFERVQSTPEKKFQLSDEQLQALELALTSKVMVITGLPGTGKTTVLRAMVRMFTQYKVKGHASRVALMTPTGISSKRLKDVSGYPAGTIHRTLGCKGADAGWDHNSRNPHPADVVIVDEASMIDQALLYRLLDGVNPKSTLIFVGDDAQLPSVGPGNVLRELIRSESLPTIKLTKIHRQEEASDIILNAHRINSGQEIVVDTKNPKTDFKFFQIADENDILEKLRYMAKGLRGKGVDFQVLSPRHKGVLGVESLNSCLQEDLNPDEGQPMVVFKSGKCFRVGDRIMVTRNNYDKGVFNGDIGTVIQIDQANHTVQFQIDGNSEPTVYDNLEASEEMVLAYCVTVHKSQGNEFPYVLMPMVESFSIQLQRNLFYTAVTRAKKKVMVFGHARALNKAIGNNKVQKRNTVFGARIRNVLAMNAT
jgi:exodeoxyribonuclease V alpha subunit